jgi:hypothetical protein
MPPFLRVLLLALPMLSSACAHSASGGGAGAVAEAGAPVETAVRVDNRSGSAVVVYLVHGGQRVRLGLVTASSTQVLGVPRQVMSGTSQQLRFIADPVGGSATEVSESLMVHPGDEVSLLVPPT